MPMRTQSAIAARRSLAEDGAVLHYPLGEGRAVLRDLNRLQLGVQLLGPPLPLEQPNSESH